jgi:hypothetical protein
VPGSAQQPNFLFPVGNMPPNYEPQFVYTGSGAGQPITGPQGLAQAAAPAQRTQLGGIPAQSFYIDSDVWEVGKRMAPSDVDVLQMRLVAAGLLDQGKYTEGIFDQNTATALASVMANANVYGAQWSDMLTSLQDARAKSGQTGQPVELANAMDLATGFQNASQQLTGREMPATASMKYASYYQQAQRANAAARAANQTYEAPMSAEAYLRANDQGAVTAYNALSRGLEFYRLLGVAV